MKSKKIFITGCGSGFGKDAALLLARRGHTVYASVHYESQIAFLKNIAEKENLNLEVLKLDVCDEKDRNKVLEYDIDIFLSNAAIGDSGSVCEIEMNRIKEVFETNVFCNIEIIQLALKNMLSKNQGRIVFISSLVGRIPLPFLSPYCCSKFAVEAFANCLRKELKFKTDCNIEVCILEPGAYDTGFNKRNYLKKYEWMKVESYFKNQINELKSYDKKLWNWVQLKNTKTVMNKYIQVVEKDHVKLRYSTPWYQSLFVQLGRIFGM